jgi:processive 1,2-diacylglycerol beta-glucosyltransferase
MKIIITYASAGSGHRRAAQALYNYFKKFCPHHDLQIIDALQKSNPLFKNIYSYGYPFLVNHALWLWRFSFWITYIRCLRPITKILVFIINRINTNNFAQFLLQKNPDFIISTHFFSSEIVAHLKKNHKLTSKLVTVITDFGIHPFWILDATDIYIVASDSSREQLILEGVEESRIQVLGIPIDSKFLNRYNKNILYKKFALEPDKFTVLIVMGSFGIGKIEKVVDLLYKEAQILVVCAQNKILYARLKKRNYAGLRIFGFVDNIQELMAISDIIITKPGGLTISESLAMGLLPIFITAIPGQEIENAKILARKSIGISIKDVALIRDMVLDFKNHPDKLKSIKEKIRQEKKPFATKDLCDVICQGSIRSTS